MQRRVFKHVQNDIYVIMSNGVTTTELFWHSQENLENYA